MLLHSAPLGASTVFQPPDGSDFQEWELEAVSGIEIGVVSEPPWAKLVDTGHGCVLEIMPLRGALQVESLSCPSSREDREDVLSLAQVLVRALVPSTSMAPVGVEPDLSLDPGEPELTSTDQQSKAAPLATIDESTSGTPMPEGHENRAFLVPGRGGDPATALPSQVPQPGEPLPAHTILEFTGASSVGDEFGEQKAPLRPESHTASLKPVPDLFPPEDSGLSAPIPPVAAPDPVAVVLSPTLGEQGKVDSPSTGSRQDAASPTVMPTTEATLNTVSGRNMLEQSNDGRPAGGRALGQEEQLDGTKVLVLSCDADCAVTFVLPCNRENPCDTSEACPKRWFLDRDEDGYGDPVCVDTRRIIGRKLVQNVGDCNDANALVHPSAVEVPQDGLDNDCDGLVR